MFSLSDILLQTAGTDQRKWKYKPRPSNAGPERCIRSLVYNALGIEPKPLPGRSILVMDDSSWHEELTFDWLNKTFFRGHSRQMGINCCKFESYFLANNFYCLTCKKQIEKNTLHGHIDGIISDGESKEHLIEHKAINHFTFRACETGDFLPYDYITQTCLYANALKNDLGKDLDFSILLVKNKNTSNYMEYHIEYDNQTDTAKVEIYRIEFNKDGFPVLYFVKESFVENIIENAINKFLLVEKYFKEKTLPKRQYEIDSWQCEYCGWNEYCYADFENEVNKMNENIDLKCLEQKVVDYFNINSQIKELTKNIDFIKEELKNGMKENNAKSAIVNEYIILYAVKERKTLKKELLPQELIMQATQKTKYESIDVKKLKKEKTNDLR